MNDYEKHTALRSAHEIAKSDAYFGARPQIDSGDRRNVFKAGFERGFDAATELEAAQAQAVPDVTDGYWIRLSSPTEHDKFRMLDCKVIDISYSDRIINVECPELTAAPTPAGSQYSAAISDAIQRGTGFVFNGKHIPYDDVVNPPAANTAQDVRNQTLEEAAKVCDRFAERGMHPSECAGAIRALKTPAKRGG